MRKLAVAFLQRDPQRETPAWCPALCALLCFVPPTVHRLYYQVFPYQVEFKRKATVPFTFALMLIALVAAVVSLRSARTLRDYLWLVLTGLLLAGAWKYLAYNIDHRLL